MYIHDTQIPFRLFLQHVGYLRPSWVILGASWKYFLDFWAHLGAVLGHLGVILGLLGSVSANLATICAPFWAILAAMSNAPFRHSAFMSHLGQLTAVLKQNGYILGAFWDHFLVIFGVIFWTTFWSLFGPLLGAILGLMALV